MNIYTDRLQITEFRLDMAEAVHLNSLDADNRRFVPDEVFETVGDAADTISYLTGCYGLTDKPLVYPVLLRDCTNIGYVQAVPMDKGEWEVGYHIGASYTGRGYATEAIIAFLPVIMKQLGIGRIYGICLSENAASARVMEKCGFEKLYEGKGLYQGEERPVIRCVYKV